MKTSVSIHVPEILPERSRVLRALGLPRDVSADARTESLLSEALSILAGSVSPAGLFREVTTDDFAGIYRGEGRNAAETPLAEVFPRAARLALFAASIGEEISRKIEELFSHRDFALGSILDAAASEATENAADVVERVYRDRLQAREEFGASYRVLRYSPGYCGWHVSGQKSLFSALAPEEIGISLRESFLMEPLKSISGVMVAGPVELHDFVDAYPFCAECLTHSCRERIRHVREQSVDGGGREET
jgi:hypothetical protein